MVHLSLVPFYLVWGEGSPTKLNYRKKLVLVLVPADFVHRHIVLCQLGPREAAAQSSRWTVRRFRRCCSPCTRPEGKFHVLPGRGGEGLGERVRGEGLGVGVGEVLGVWVGSWVWVVGRFCKVNRAFHLGVSLFAQGLAPFQAFLAIHPRLR